MDDQDVLRHLLGVEASAAALVDDAQAEADRRLTEVEKKNRAAFDEQYGIEVATLEARYTAEIVAVKENYQKQLDAYRESPDTIHPDTSAFRRLLDTLLAQVS